MFIRLHSALNIKNISVLIKYREAQNYPKIKTDNIKPEAILLQTFSYIHQVSIDKYIDGLSIYTYIIKSS